ncbi:hypothetical protein DY052_05815 [Apilactobacillus timberlakei]|uniref:hypothetical protein n=1 Tax=Apilactobacillus timberlakei TaxID=2008380 RepID=UPI001126A185|nr:hypothetical protein [Apilactobacillus timberlakei]TPR14939.1 hypothetical protein DY052_05815 [Apilactobacillus timberlakei]
MNKTVSENIVKELLKGNQNLGIDNAEIKDIAESDKPAFNNFLAKNGYMTAKKFKKDLQEVKDTVYKDDYVKALKFIKEHPYNIYSNLTFYVYASTVGELPILVTWEDLLNSLLVNNGFAKADI